MAAALTLTSAITNAQRVFDKKEPVCLDREFQVVANLANRATFQELMERAKRLPETEGSFKKNRLFVILRLIYNVTNETDKKEVKPKAKAEGPQAKQGKGPKETSKKELAAAIFAEDITKGLSPAEQKQFELSILLLGYETVYFDYQWASCGIKAHKLLTSFRSLDPYSLFYVPKDAKSLCLVINPKQIANPKYSGFLFQWAKLFDPTTYTLNLRYLSHSDYEELCRFRSHPDREISLICDFICKQKEVDFEWQKMDRLKETYLKAVSFLAPHLKGNSGLFFSVTFPKSLALLTFKPPEIDPQNPGKDYFYAFLEKRLPMCREAETQFFAAYEKLYSELHEIQKNVYPKQKEFFLKNFNCRLHASFLPKRSVIRTFLPPKQLRSEISLDTITTQEKEDAEPKAGRKKSTEAPPEKLAAPKVSEKEPEVTVLKPPPEPSKIKQILEKREFPFKTITYDPRVLEWFEKRKKAIEGFTPEDGIWIHSFTRIVDQFLGTPYSLTDSWKNTTSGNADMRFCILADITLPSKETIEGVFQFTFDKKGVCYHRCFAKMESVQRFEKAISQIREKISFPPLVKYKPSSLEEIDQTEFTIDPHFESITFKDEENNLIIKIYKTKE